MTRHETFTIRALAEYAARVGAEQINFRKYMVKVYEGTYPREKAFIYINREGEVKCSDPKYAPTPEEQEAIKQEVANTQFPQSIHADDINELLPLMQSPVYHEFRDVDGDGLIVMVQERRDQEDGGGKYFITWTKFSD